jgi:hypothetical protein
MAYYGGDGGPAKNAYLSSPSAVAFAANGLDYFIADPGNVPQPARDFLAKP